MSEQFKSLLRTQVKTLTIIALNNVTSASDHVNRTSLFLNTDINSFHVYSSYMLQHFPLSTTQPNMKHIVNTVQVHSQKFATIDDMVKAEKCWSSDNVCAARHLT